jgi:WD40 repeat protein/outer membrane protein assembly factor BamE (lipoprotein component of BamABCDE complex)
MSRAAVPLVALAALSLAGCVVLPLPPMGAQVGHEEIEKLQPGSSTRDDVRTALGAPSHSLTNRYEIFDVSRETAHVLFAVLYMGGQVSRIDAQDFRVLVEYRPDGVVESVRWEGLEGESRYISSGSPPTAGSMATSPIGPQPGLTWTAPDFDYPIQTAAVAVAPKGSVVAISYGNASRLVRIDLHNWRTGALLAWIGEAPAGCPKLISPSRMRMPTVFLSDDRHLASVAEDAVVCIWDSATQRRLLTFEKHRKPTSFFGLTGGNRLTSLVAARSAPILATADGDNVVRVWNGLSGREILAIEPCSFSHGCGAWVAPSLSRLALSDDGRVLALFQAGEREDALRLWDTSTGVELGSLTAPKKARSRYVGLVNLALSPDRRWVALHMGDHVEVWSTDENEAMSAAQGAAAPPGRSFELEQVFVLPPVDVEMASYGPSETHHFVRSIEFSADGRRLVAGDGVAMLWKTGSWRELWRASLGSRELWPAMSDLSAGFALTADGRHIVTARGVWELPGPDESATPTT